MPEWKLQKENQICTVQYYIHEHVMRDGVVTDYIKKILSVQNDKKLVPGQSPGEPHKSEIERKIKDWKKKKKKTVFQTGNQRRLV